MKRVLLFFIILVIAIPADAALAQERQAIEILYEHGFIKGDGKSLAPERYMTCGEFLITASRICGFDMESAFGDWRKAALMSAYGLCPESEVYESVTENFDEPITPQLAQDIMIGMLLPPFKDGDIFIYGYDLGTGESGAIIFNGLSEIGYDISVIPHSQHITREEACKMLCELLYLEYPVVGDYRPGGVMVCQYTLYGEEMVFDTEIYPDIYPSKNLFGKRPKRQAQWELPKDIRSRLFLEENISVGMRRDHVEDLIGKAYKTDGNVEIYYYYTPFDEKGGYGFMEIEYDNDALVKLAFLPV